MLESQPVALRALRVSDAPAILALYQTNAAYLQPWEAVRPPEFFYVGGEIASPGQKGFHAGMTLTQALLASGGATRPEAARVRVLRAGPDGRLSPTEYNLREIENGVVPDPQLQPGDRIEVATGSFKKK